MAKYSVTHSCKHDETITLFGPNKDRERRLEWLRSLPCPECASIDGINSAAAVHQLQQAAGLPRLVGSEKQVAWGVQVRQDFLVGWKKIERKLTDAAMTDQPTAKLAEELLFEGDAFVAGPLTHEDARYWIDNRENLTESAIQSHLYKIRHQIAEQARAIVADNLPITDSDKREIIRMALDAQHVALEERRAAEAAKRAEAAKAAADQLKAKNEKLWVNKDRLAAAVHAAVGDRAASISIYWKDTEKRVYLDSAAGWKACLYVTGNSRNRPGSIGDGRDTPLVRAALEMCASDWKSIRLDVTADGKAG